MKKNLSLASVLTFLFALASFVAAAKGHGPQTFGFFSGG